MTTATSATDLVGPIQVLLVEPSATDRAFFHEALVSSGCHVTVAESFHEARAVLDLDETQLLITELRLGAYNGLHLVMRSQARHPGMAAIITTGWVDPVLQSESERMGTTFVAKPIDKSDFLAAVTRTCFRQAGDMGPIRPPFERRHATRRLAAGAVPVTTDRRTTAERRRSYSLTPQTLAT
jgi:DNA-binding NtrC family response regulator